MQCPVCKNVNLVMADRQGVEIDYCPSCRGVWLDRGELDKIIDRSAGIAPPPPPVQPVQRQEVYQAPQQHLPQHQPQQQQQHQGFGHSQSSHGYPQQGYQKKKKKEGFLGELFDFD